MLSQKSGSLPAQERPHRRRHLCGVEVLRVFDDDAQLSMVIKSIEAFTQMRGHGLVKMALTLTSQ